MKPTPRIVAQVSIALADGAIVLAVVSNDGVAFMYEDPMWRQLPALPQPEERKKE